ncbi:ATP-binding protein [Psychromonas sp. MME2]|uniref:AAA family ATPase n=1 Tax=unclassified Psychromonas TaxID=2614957 RepID=UPI00339CF45F
MGNLGTLHFLIGKMGAGKTTYSTTFASESNVVLISEDEWLTKLYPDEINDFDDFVVRHHKLLDVLAPHVQQILKAGSSVVLDFPANTIDSRKWYLDVANAVNAPHRAIYLKVSNEKCLEQISKRRIEQPERAKYDTPEMFETVNQYFEEPLDSEGVNIHVVTQSA